MSDTGWDDYIATDAAGAVAEVQSETDNLATAVNEDPDASLTDQLAVIDAQDSAYQASSDQALADSSQATGDWQAQQADSWEQWAQSSAAEGLGDLAASSAANAEEFAGAAESSYSDAGYAEANVVSDLDDTAASVSSIDTTAEVDSAVADPSADGY
jgi:hypothetical protein